MASREIFDTVPDAIYAVAHRGPVSLPEQARRMGLNEKQLRAAVDPMRSPRYPAEWVATQAVSARDYAVLRTICRDAGGVFVALPRATADTGDIVAALGEVLREVGEDAALIGRHLADGRVDPHEAKAAIDELDQTASRLAALRQLLVERMTPRRRSA